MKLTAEFNSVEEILNFAKTFERLNPASVVKTMQSIEPKEAIIKAENKNVQEAKEEQSEANKEDKKEEYKVTKEMLRERLGTIMKAGKQKEVKELVAKFGASKVPDLKEEDYAAVYMEAEALL